MKAKTFTAPFQSKLIPFQNEIFQMRFGERKPYKVIQEYLETKGIKITIPSLYNFIAVRSRRPDPFAWPEHLRPTANPPAPTPVTVPAGIEAMRSTTEQKLPQDLEPHDRKTPTKPCIMPPQEQTHNNEEEDEEIKRHRKILRNLPDAATWDKMKAEEEKRKKAERR